MRKFILGAVVLAAAASFSPASADAGNGCTIQGGAYGPSESGTCTYTATGNDTSILVLTPNHVDVTYPTHAVIDGVCSPTGTANAFHQDSADPSQGVKDVADIPATDCAGPVEVTVTVGPDSAGFGVDGWVGLVAIAETA